MKAHIITKDQLKTGDSLLYEKTIAIGRIEQIFTRSKYNHSSLVIKMPSEILCIEAILPEVTARLLNKSLLHTVEVIVKRPKFEFDEFKFKNLCTTLVGKKYDIPGLLAQIPHQIWGGWIGNKSINKTYCSKANAWVWNQLNPELYKEWYKTSPDELFEDLLDFETYILKY